MAEPTLMISADHGLSIVYFLQTDVLPTLLAGGARVVLLTDDGLKDQIQARFGQPGLTVEGLRLDQLRRYFNTHHRTLQYWLHFLRWMGGSRRINTAAMDGHLAQMGVEASRGGKMLMPAIRALTYGLRRSALLRKWLVNYQMRFTPQIYGDLFDKYQPQLVVASTPGWRWDRYLLREAHRRGVATAAAIIGWDNPSSYRLPGAPVDWVTCWSDIQKKELVLGSDWPEKQVNVGGIPSYDGYFLSTWRVPREEYYARHGLDPQRKLIAYASSFVTFAPNLRNIQSLVRLVASDGLIQPAQLLIRLHPNHFLKGSLYEKEAEQVRALVRENPHVHLVEPVPLGGELGYYSGEDMPEKDSMMAYADVFVTVYSTMVVETAIHDRPIVSACLDTPGGWNTAGKFSLPLSQIGNWPTHLRFREARAGLVASEEDTLREAINFYLQNPKAHSAERRAFVEREVTYTDGSAGRRTGEYFLSRLGKRGV